MPKVSSRPTYPVNVLIKRVEVGPAQVDKRSEAASSLNAVTDTSLSASGSADTMNFSVDDMDSFQLFASEMFDPSVIEGFNQSPVDGMAFINGLWEGFPCGG